MENYELINLGLQVETLIKSRAQLREENCSLRQKLLKLTQEKAILADKNQRAISKIKKIIAHLRAERK